MHGRVAVDQLAGGPVDVIDTAAQQHGLQAATGVPDRTCGNGAGGQRWYSSRRALAGGGRAEADRSQVRWVRDAWISGAVPHGSLAGIACRSGLHVLAGAP